jgi:hypothetical protein
MPNSKRKSSSKRRPRRSAKRGSTHPSGASLVYRGPYKLPGAREQNTLYTMEIRSLLTLSSSVGGVINQVFDNNPSGYQDWSSIAALWDEYRPLSIFVEYKPYNRYSKVTTVTRPMYLVADRDSVGALGSVNAAIQYESCRVVSLEDFWSSGVKTEGALSLGGTTSWTTTASPVASYCLKTYTTGLSASTTYGDVLVTTLIQLRGRN